MDATTPVEIRDIAETKGVVFRCVERNGHLLIYVIEGLTDGCYKATTRIDMMDHEIDDLEAWEKAFGELCDMSYDYYDEDDTAEFVKRIAGDTYAGYGDIYWDGVNVLKYQRETLEPINKEIGGLLVA